VGRRAPHVDAPPSVRTDGSACHRTTQSFTTPWLALSHHSTPQGMVYASWGQGIESEVVPNRSRYTNAGQALPALKSRQSKWATSTNGALRWTASRCSTSTAPSGRRRRLRRGAHLHAGGGWPARHRGLSKATLEWRAGAWSLRASALWLRPAAKSQQTGAERPATDQCAERTASRLQATYNVAALPGLACWASSRTRAGAGAARQQRADTGLDPR
jgi:iron complex outermembrane receptor protein